MGARRRLDSVRRTAGQPAVEIHPHRRSAIAAAGGRGRRRYRCGSDGLISCVRRGRTAAHPAGVLLQKLLVFTSTILKPDLDLYKRSTHYVIMYADLKASYIVNSNEDNLPVSSK